MKKHTFDTGARDKFNNPYTIKDDRFICNVCKQKFSDLWEHLSVNKTGFFKFKDRKHSDYFKKIRENGYHDQTCYCGGHITIRGAGVDSWETTCDSCGFIYDES